MYSRDAHAVHVARDCAQTLVVTKLQLRRRARQSGLPLSPLTTDLTDVVVVVVVIREYVNRWIIRADGGCEGKEGLQLTAAANVNALSLIS